MIILMTTSARRQQRDDHRLWFAKTGSALLGEASRHTRRCAGFE